MGSDADVSADAPGKSGLNVTYSLPYKTKNTLSVRFMISIFHKGAAHPANTVSTLNFINGSQVQLSELFRPEVDYLKPMADFCYKNNGKNISDKNGLEKVPNLPIKTIKFGLFRQRDRRHI